MECRISNIERNSPFDIRHSNIFRLWHTRAVKILIALSGGIDSSVVAHLLKEQGHELVGVRFTLWSDPLAPAMAQILPSKCCNAQTAMRSRTVAESLGIPFHVVDLEQDFKERVVDPYLDAHRDGLTPNPCIGCNREVKFGRLLDLMREYGCERLATGHYARVAKEESENGGRYVLLEAVDERKDQSYYLYGLSQEQLKHVLFPLGGMRKDDVFALARKYGVPFDEQYKESQDLCFFPEKSPQEFLKRHITDAITPGPIERRDGTVVGTHKGLPLYTQGQRKGLGVGGLKIPLEVVAKDASRNALIVSDRDSEPQNSVTLTDLRWVSWRPPENEEISFECRTRSLSLRKHGRIRYTGNRAIFTFDDAQPPLSPGQSLVLYRGQEIVGGGVMAV